MCVLMMHRLYVNRPCLIDRVSEAILRHPLGRTDRGWVDTRGLAGGGTYLIGAWRLSSTVYQVLTDLMLLDP